MERRLNRTNVVAMLVALTTSGSLAFVGCSGDGQGSPDATSEDAQSDGADAQDGFDATPGLALGQQVPWPTEEWPAVEPVAMGMDAAVLEGAREYAFAPHRNTQAVIVVRGGAIVAEWYAEGAGTETFAASWSAAKSVLSALVGIALAEGLIESVDVPLGDFFPEWEGTPKGDITLRQTLQMQTGLHFELGSLADVDDTVAFALSRTSTHEPDAIWRYSNADSQLIEGVLEAATGMTGARYAEERLFGAIGMDPVEWWSDGAGHTLALCCIDSPSRSFARFGLLYLRGGEWDGEQVVPSEWVLESTTELASQSGGAYAYHWWTTPPDSGLPPDLYWALGVDHQLIYVIPSLDLVVVRNSVYRKYPGAPVATGGFGEYFSGDYGTLGPLSWVHEAFLAPIINAIEGAEPVEVPDCGDFEAACLADEGCASILECARRTGCGGVDCYQRETCRDVIDATGGPTSASTVLALPMTDCLD
jgi:CubicO group peptidase (beta-lactamase class C family)